MDMTEQLNKNNNLKRVVTPSQSHAPCTPGKSQHQLSL